MVQHPIGMQLPKRHIYWSEPEQKKASVFLIYTSEQSNLKKMITSIDNNRADTVINITLKVLVLASPHFISVIYAYYVITANLLTDPP